MPALNADTGVELDDVFDEVYDLYSSYYDESDTLGRSIIRLENVLDDLRNYQKVHKL